MSTETAELFVAIAAGVGFIAWLAGLQFLIASARVGRNEAPAGGNLGEPLPENWLVGSADVDGQPAALAKRAAAFLVKETAGPLGPIKIVERNDNRLVFEHVGPVTGAGQGSWLRRGEMRFTALDNRRTRIDYAIERGSIRWLLRVGALFLLLGLLVLVVGGGLMVTLVIPSPDPALRTQAVQMVQVVHFLWPPFLMGYLYRRGIRSVRATFDALAHNLPYAG
jgi:hypothetical protein